jgi:hypothetical protein
VCDQACGPRDSLRLDVAGAPPARSREKRCRRKRRSQSSPAATAIALGLARTGVRIVIDNIAHPDATDELAKELSGLDDQAIGVEADASKGSSTPR